MFKQKHLKMLNNQRGANFRNTTSPIKYDYYFQNGAFKRNISALYVAIYNISELREICNDSL